MKLGRAFLLSGLLAALIALPSAAHAQPFRGFYLGAAAGANFMGEESIHSSSALGLPSGRAAFSDGFVGLGSVGYGFGDGFRVELEGDWRSNPLHAVLRPGDPTAASGRQTAKAVMANVLFDLDIGSRWVFPYLGAGIGYAWTKWQGVEARGPGSLYTASGTSGGFAFQAMFGLSFPVPRVPGLSFTAEYRFFDVPGSLTMPSTYTAGGHVSSGNTDLSFDHAQSLLLGVRYAFGVRPPKVPEEPSESGNETGPAAARPSDFLVSFDGNDAGLDDRTRSVLANAARRARAGQPARVVLADPDPALAARREAIVAAQLIADGVPAEAIALPALGGDANLAHPGTAGLSGIRDPRVAIVLR